MLHKNKPLKGDSKISIYNVQTTSPSNASGGAVIISPAPPSISFAFGETPSASALKRKT